MEKYKREHDNLIAALLNSNDMSAGKFFCKKMLENGKIKDSFCSRLDEAREIENIDACFISGEVKEKIICRFKQFNQNRNTFLDSIQIETFELSFNNYLNNFKEYLLFLFSLEEDLTNSDLLKTHNPILWDTIECADKTAIKIKYSNIYILAILKKIFQGYDKAREVLAAPEEKYKQIFMGLLREKASNLFKRFTLGGNGFQYYLNDLDNDDMTFYAESFEKRSSVYQIDFSRLYEKIKYYNEKLKLNSNEGRKIAIIGKCDTASLEHLRQLIGDEKGERYQIDCFEKGKSEYINIFNNCQKLKKMIDEYSQIFILDCPELYVKRLREYQRNTRVERSNEKNIKDIFRADDDRQIFRTVDNNFFDLLERFTQFAAFNGTGYEYETKYRLNTSFLETLKELSQRDKEIFVYVSKEESLENSDYAYYNIVRKERYNSQDIRIIKFDGKSLGNKGKIGAKVKNAETQIDLTLYKIVKMMSSDKDFLEVFCDKDIAFNDMAVKLDNIKMSVHYKDYKNLKIRTDKNDNNILTTVLELAFKELPENFLLDCFRRTFFITLVGAAQDYNDYLFCHLYRKTYLNEYSIKRQLFKYEQEYGEDKSALADNDEKAGYGSKRLALQAMTLSDTRGYDMFTSGGLSYMAGKNSQSYDECKEDIIKACKNLDYTNSLLYINLHK